MALAPCGTFDYVAVVPDDVHGGTFGCPVETRRPVVCTGDDINDSRLVGWSPVLRVTNAGLPEDAGPRRPRVFRSRLTLSATGREHARLGAASFHVAKGLVTSLMPGDVLHMARTLSGGLGVSVVRGGELVVAAGTVSAVPLGETIHAGAPVDLLKTTTEAFRRQDPEFEFHEIPLELTVGQSVAILFRGRRKMGGYGVYMEHGHLKGLPDTDECLAIYREGLCSDVDASTSAQFLADASSFSMTRW
jgi:hypothetical protein